jgi:hypothetical protein
MEKNYAVKAAEYYKLVGEKNAEGFKKFLHPDVEFYGPLATLKGKEAVIEATSKFMSMFKSFTILAKFGAENQAMIVYELDIPGIVKEFPSASLLNFSDGQIVRIQLFYDARPFVAKSEEIFSKT